MARKTAVRVFQGDQLIDTIVFEREIIKIGRLASAHLKLDDKNVSRIHAVIEVHDEVSIIDMGSQEGTQVNGSKIARQTLSHGDQITLGDSRLVMILDEDDINAIADSENGTGQVAIPQVTNPNMTAPNEIGGLIDGGDFGESTRAVNVGDLPVGAYRPDAPSSAVAEQTTQVAISPGAPPKTNEVDVSQIQSHSPAAGVATTQPITPVTMTSEATPEHQAVVASPDVVTAALAVPPAVVAAAAAAVPQPTPVSPSAPTAAMAPPSAAALAAGMRSAPPAPAAIPEDPITSDNRFMEVTLRWGSAVVEVLRVRDQDEFTIGTAGNVDVFVPVEDVGGGEKFALLTKSKGSQDWNLNFTPQMGGSLQRGGQSTPLQSAGHGSISMGDGDSADVSIGSLNLEIRPVSKSLMVPVVPFLDSLFINTSIITGLFCALLFGAVTIFPPDLDDNEDDLNANLSEFQALILEKKETKFLKRFNAGKKAAAAKGAKGKAGKKNEKKTDGKMASKAAEEIDDEKVVSSKLAALFGKDGRSGIDTLFGADSGGSLEAALGNINGSKIGDAAGNGGLGVRGNGPGGGGTEVGTLGIGKVGTRGRGTGNGRYGSGTGGLGKGGDRTVGIAQGNPIIMGSLDKEIIRRVVKSHMSQIKYCYETELTKNPGLSGKVTMKWVISGSGSVQSSSVADSSLKNKSVENCISRKIRTWKFPKPKGGGIVVVNYPFVLKSSS